MDAAMDRITASWALSQAKLQDRIEAGTQPGIVLVGTSNMEILLSNCFYLFVTWALYQIMSRRAEGFGASLKPLIAIYNAICVFLAGYVVYGIVEFKLENPDDLKFVCNDGARIGPVAERLGWVFWVFYAQKFWEFMDTWFFILRKSFRQVTLLHVYHHASITVVVGMVLPHQFTGDVYLPIFLNAFIHVLMYSHYLVTVLGYKSWWSQYLTSMQLIQFLLIAFQSYLAWTHGPECGLYDWQKVLIMGYMGTMLVLFGNFFVNKYLGGGAKGAKKPVEASKTKAA